MKGQTRTHTHAPYDYLKKTFILTGLLALSFPCIPSFLFASLSLLLSPELHFRTDRAQLGAQAITGGTPLISSPPSLPPPPFPPVSIPSSSSPVSLSSIHAHTCTLHPIPLFLHSLPLAPVPPLFPLPVSPSSVYSFLSFSSCFSPHPCSSPFPFLRSISFPSSSFGLSLPLRTFSLSLNLFLVFDFIPVTFSFLL